MRVAELAVFGAVGTAAFAVHVGVVATLVPLGSAPLAANVIAFATAFAVSFLGHARWSFPLPRRRIAATLPRFGAVALGAFALNEGLYAFVLHQARIDYRLALLLVNASAAGLTWLASKRWAFADV